MSLEIADFQDFLDAIAPAKPEFRRLDIA